MTDYPGDLLRSAPRSADLNARVRVVPNAAMLTPEVAS
jgi:hypothetical protein